jgi:NADH-quinone oxidoreductase subunit L
MGIAAAFMTAFYSWRLLFLIFHGEPRADKRTMEQVHESPLVMTIPLAGLAAGALFAGWIGYDTFVGEGRAEFWRGVIKVLDNHDSIDAAHHVPLWVKLAPLVVSAVGIGLAAYMYIMRLGTAERLANTFPGLYRFLLNKWYFDELYDWMFVRPASRIGRLLWKGGDGAIIDGYGPDGLAAMVVRAARRLGVVQTGYLYHYAFAMIVGIALVVTWIVAPWGTH